jgi:diaminopimelate epimerase
MILRFTKMQALGNDFVMLDGIRQRVALSDAQIRRLADRHYGVGCDQVLVVEPASDSRADFRYRIFNADGGEVEQCGNGARCFVRFLREEGLTEEREIVVETCNGVMTLTEQDDGSVTVNMGVPRLAPQDVPFVAESPATLYDLDIGSSTVRILAVSMGNPHAVQRVDDVDRAPVAEQGPLIERHRRFPRGANAGFVQIVDRHRIRVRVFERGVGETLACGSGACAAVVAGRLWGALDETVEVELRGGSLNIRWDGEGHPVLMTGPAATVFKGTIDL